MIEKNLKYEAVVDYFFDNLSLSFNFNVKVKEQIINLVNKQESLCPDLYNYLKINPVFFDWKTLKFPVFIKPPTSLIENNKINFDIFLNSFFLLSGIQELNSTNKDKHNRFEYESSLQYKHNFIQTPVVNIYFELVYEKAIENGIKIKRKQFDSPIVFTHDIDQLRSGWFEDIKHELSNFRFNSIFSISKSIFSKTFGLKDSYQKAFENMLLIDNENNINSISFFMSKKSHKDADYDITKSKFKKIVNLSKSKTQCEFHPGYNTCDNEQEFKNQLKVINQIKSHKTTKVRQHFLKFDMKKTPKIHELNNIEQDFSLGFPEMYGFRNSIASPFYLFNFEKQKKYKTVEIPLFFMDSTILDYIKTPFEEECNKLLTVANKTVLDFNCNFSILFHNSAFSNKKYKGLISMYKKFILLSKNNGCSNKEI